MSEVDNISCKNSNDFLGKLRLIFHVNRLLADDSDRISSFILSFRAAEKFEMSPIVKTDWPFKG